MKAFLKEMCEVFGARDPKQLVGKKCYALRPYGTWNDPIEGLENMDGQRFTITGFRKRHYPEHASSRLEDKRESLKNDIAWAKRRQKAAEAELRKVEENYVDWETQ